MNLKEQLGEAVKGFSTEIKVEFKPRLPEALITAFNSQIQKELYSANLYKAMSSYLNDKGYVYASHVFFKYGEEEMSHMDKIIKYLYDRNCKVIIPACNKPPDNFTGIKEVITKSLEHEMLVTSNWEDIAKLSKELNDSTSLFFSNWFLNEQIEEEDKFRNLLYLIDLNIPDWELELRFKESL